MQKEIMLNDIDAKVLAKITFIRNSLNNFVGTASLIKDIKELVAETEIFDFKNARARELINKKKPVFVLELKHEGAKKLTGYNKINFKELNDVDTDFNDDNKVKAVSFVNNALNSEIIKPYTNKLVKVLRSSEFNAVLKKNNIDIGDVDISNASFLLTTVFGVTISFENNTIYLEYAV